MAIEQILNTRIQLKYDTWENWNISNAETQSAGTNADLVLKSGELGICLIPANSNAGESTFEPIVLFKVGTYDGINENTKKTFKELPWASALAADVFPWAKESALHVTHENKGNFVTGIEWDAAANDGKGGIKIITEDIPDHSISAHKLKACSDYSNEDAEVLILNCGTATEVV